MSANVHKQFETLIELNTGNKLNIIIEQLLESDIVDFSSFIKQKNIIEVYYTNISLEMIIYIIQL